MPSWLSGSAVCAAPLAFQDPRRLWFLHPTHGGFSAQVQQFSTVQITYAEQGSQVLLDVLMAEHGLQGSLWKFWTRFNKGKLDRISTQERSCQNLPCKWSSEHSSPSNIWLKPGPSIAVPHALQLRQLNAILHVYFTCRCCLVHVPDFPLVPDRNKGRSPAWNLIYDTHSAFELLNTFEHVYCHVISLSYFLFVCILPL